MARPHGVDAFEGLVEQEQLRFGRYTSKWDRFRMRRNSGANQFAIG